ALADFNLANQTATQAELESAWAEVNQAQDELDNVANSPTESELQSTWAQVAQAQAQLDELMAGPSSHELAIAEAQVEQARLSLQQAELQLAEATLGAPFRGTVVSLSAEEGETVAANAEAVLVADLSALEISLDMDEVDVGRAQLGQVAGVFLDAFPDQALRGEVTQIAYVGTETQGVVNYPVTVRIDPNDLPIKPGMTANASIVIERRENVLVVPNRALKARGQQWVVEVLVEGEITEVPVKAGLSGDTGTEVVEGLQEGDLVVIGTTQAGGESQGRGFGGPPFGGGPHF
ncbi:MAG: efflux RND transporter periplasmic adaptor subunit, partial [Anaerolineae bacterium]